MDISPKCWGFSTLRKCPCHQRRPHHQRHHHSVAFDSDLQSPGQFSNDDREPRGGAPTAEEPPCEGDHGRGRPSQHRWGDTEAETREQGEAMWNDGVWWKRKQKNKKEHVKEENKKKATITVMNVVLLLFLNMFFFGHSRHHCTCSTV